jgi:hypothetical protein
MGRFAAALTGVALVAAAAAGLALATLIGSPSASSTRSEARSVASDFFTSLNQRRYDRTCELLSEGYLQTHRLESTDRCLLGLRIGFLWSQEIRFRILDVRLRGGRAIVRAVADGAPGTIVLVREDGRFKVLAVEGA